MHSVMFIAGILAETIADLNSLFSEIRPRMIPIAQSLMSVIEANSGRSIRSVMCMAADLVIFSCKALS